tara:strand:- start:4021 stop:4188 length:168 start_codon:yes stop_codon:yes gene_type:complete
MIMKKEELNLDNIPLDAIVVAGIVLAWSLPIILAYLFIRLCIVRPIHSLFGGKKK